MTTLDLYQPQQVEITRGGGLADHPAIAYLSGLGKNTRRPQKQALDVIAGILTGGQADCLAVDWGAVKYAHAAAIRSRLAEMYAPGTANRMLTAFRGVIHAARNLQLMGVDDWHAITAPRIGALKAVTGETIPAGRELSAGELGALFADCQADPGPAGIRDGAMIALAYAAGLRRAEVVGLDLASYDQETGRLVIFGKRSKERTAYIKNGVADWLADWLDLRGSEPGPLFLAIDKGRSIRPGQRLTTQAVYKMLAKRGKAAGVSHFSPHDLRRTYVSDLLEAGADIATVAKMAGHANIQTTARYDRRPEQAKEKAAGLLHVPYAKRKK